jgi:demethylmenaquinone methyltransferase/2-methoxy-6-polyprenyl-1,4-benzoquinol methylase
MDDVFKEQLTYYNARAREYDESLQGVGSSSTTQPEYEEANQEWQHIVNALRALGPVDDILELACGTGIWTRELMSIGASITAIDGSSEMIEINRANRTAAIEYQCRLFHGNRNNMTAFCFWLYVLSHLSFQQNARTRPGGEYL